jgi:hypothetical protein
VAAVVSFVLNHHLNATFFAENQRLGKTQHSSTVHSTLPNPSLHKIFNASLGELAGTILPSLLSRTKIVITFLFKTVA